MTSIPRIAIVGGGPGGLSLGLLLHQHNIPFTIFELRDKPTEEELSTPSGMLDLHEESGLAVLKECGLYSAFLPLTGECSQDFLVSDRNGKFLYNPSNGDDSGGSRPEISRNNLLKLFLSTLPSDTIKWNHKLQSATKKPNQAQTTLHFENNPTPQTFDLVIGADGAWSKVRALLLPNTHPPSYTGMQIATLTIKNITTKHPHLATLVGSGTFTSLGSRHAVISQRGPVDSARIYLWITFPSEETSTTTLAASQTASDLKTTLLTDPSLFGTFGPTIKELISTAFDEELASTTPPSLEIRPLYALPYGFSWEHTTGVTVVGDAAHLMLPNGEGVNSAMLDSLVLARAIVKAWEGTVTNEEGKDSVEAFQRAFGPLLRGSERALVERAVASGKETEVLIGMMFGRDDAAYGFVKSFEDMVAAGGAPGQ